MMTENLENVLDTLEETKNKEQWLKPEINLVNIKNETLGNSNIPSSDAGTENS